MKKKAPPEFARWLKKTMKDKGWGISETARRAGLTHTPLSYVVTNGEVPSFETCVGLAKAFGVPLETVLIRAGYLPSTGDNPIREEIIFLLKRMNDETMLKIVLATAREAAKREKR